jgi:cobalt-precorrin 5A hydrolase
MGGEQAMITAGLGCRKGCTAAELVRLIQAAGLPDRLAAPEFKRDEPGLHEAACQLGLPLVFVPDAALAAAQLHCVTRSAAAERATGHASVAEAAALAGGGTLLGPRIASANATCALACSANSAKLARPR